MQGRDSKGHVEVELTAGFTLAFGTVEMMESFTTYEPPTGGHRVSFAFRCDSAPDVDETFARLKAAGSPVRVEPFDASWGQRYATVLDPDGTPVDVYAPL